MPDIDWDNVEVKIPPKKKAISIRVDDDVLGFFKKQSGGYQTHMNAVLRAYVDYAKRQRRPRS